MTRWCLGVAVERLVRQRGDLLQGLAVGDDAIHLPAQSLADHGLDLIDRYAASGGLAGRQRARRRGQQTEVLAGLRPIPTRRVMIGFRCQRGLTQGPAVNWPTAATRYADAW